MAGGPQPLRRAGRQSLRHASGRLADETVLRDLDPLPPHGFDWEFEAWDNHLACPTAIDADERSRFTPGPVAIAAGESRRLNVADGSLRNITHWGFCVSGAVCGTRLAVETASGALFDFQIGDSSGCCVWVVAEGDSRHCAVWLPLDSGAAGRRPTGHVVALVLHQPASAPMLLLSGAWLARPRPGWRRDPRCAKGMPARSSAGIADPA